MHVRFLEIFCDVALHRSFSKAAALHEVSQPTATQAVQAVEEDLGVQLIDRTQRPLVLTPAGEAYNEAVRKALGALRAGREHVSRLRDQVTGQVHVAAIFSVGLLQMDSLIRRFEGEYPGAKAKIDFHHPNQVESLVLNDEADLGILSFPKETRDLAVVPWQEQPMRVVVSPKHRLARRNCVDVKELVGERFVAFTSELGIRKQIDKWLKQSRVSVQVVMGFDNIEEIKRAVEIDTGLAILPGPTVRREVETGSLRALPITDVAWTRPLGIIHRKHRELPVAVRKFIELMQTATNGTGESPAPANPLNSTLSANPKPSRRKRVSKVG